MDPREAERFEEGLDPEYHDATEEPQDIEKPDPAHTPRFSHGGFGSSSMRECIELLDKTRSNSPAALHSGVKTEKKSDRCRFIVVWDQKGKTTRLTPQKQ